MPSTFDLIVIGAGMAGVAAATKAANAGKSVAIVDELPYGGTCALRGCDPKKILRRGAEIIDSAQSMRGKGISEGGLSINWADLMEHKRGFTDHVPGSMERDLKESGVTTLYGQASFSGRQSLDVDGISFQSENFLISTGSTPRALDFAGQEHVIDSTQFLELRDLPKRILFVGGGFVSFEFAHIAARAGSDITIIDRGERPLPAFDPDMVDLMVEDGRRVDVDVRRNSQIASIEPLDVGYRVVVEAGGEGYSVETDLVVHGAGRVAALANLHLDRAGVAYGDKGVLVGRHLQSTTNPAVWGAGDAADTAGLPLTPIAVIEAKVAISNLLKSTTQAPDYAGTPTAVFTIPELVKVGLTEDEAKAAGVDLSVLFSDTSDWYSNYRVGQNSAAAKILLDRSTDTIVGAHFFGPEYAELANTFALAIKLGITAKQLRAATSTYPTVGSDLAAMLAG